MSNSVVLFVNHREHRCGVHQFGKRLYSYIAQSQEFDPYYIDIADIAEFNHWVKQLSPAIVLYNYYSGATMPWCTPQHIRTNKGKFKQACIFHESSLESMGFDLLFHQDPSFEGKPGYATLTRPIPIYRSQVTVPPYPTFGSFGFGLGGKGFGRIIEIVRSEYDAAKIRFNIPYAAFGDSTGSGARSWADHCHSMVKGSAIDLEVTHDLLPENELIDWLAGNTANCFFYDSNYGRGISGTIDYAIAACRPIAITKSYQFQHIWKADDSFCIENRNLRDIVDMGIGPLEKFQHMWSPLQLTRRFELGFYQLLGL